MQVREASSNERDLLISRRAEIWRGVLSVQHYTETIQYLYRHNFGRKRIKTWVGVEGTEIVCSCETLDIPLLTNSNGNIRETRGSLLASVNTPVHHRKKGYASQLIEEVLSKLGDTPGVLYSDIGPHYYKRWNYQEQSRWLVKEKPEPNNKLELKPLTTEEGLEKIRQSRKKELEASGQIDALCVYPDSEWLDWVLSRYRHYAFLKSQPAEGHVFWSVESPTQKADVLAVPHHLARNLHGLWFSDEELGVAASKKLADQFPLEEVEYWTREPGNGGHLEVPMARTGPRKGAIFVGPQALDWW